MTMNKTFFTLTKTVQNSKVLTVLIFLFVVACQKNSPSQESISSPHHSHKIDPRSMVQGSEQLVQESIKEIQAETLSSCETSPINFQCPVKNQGPSTWCNSFAPTDLINQISSEGLASSLDFSSMSAPHNKIHLFRWIDSRRALEALQQKGIIKAEESLPFDVDLVTEIYQELNFYFENHSLRENTVKQGNHVTGAHYRLLIDQEQLALNLKKSPKNIKNFQELYSFELSELEALYPLNESFLNVPNFSITSLHATKNQIDQFFQHLIRIVGQGRYVSFPVCGNLLTSKKEGSHKDCGLHKVNLIATRLSSESGQCEFLLKNSWGEGWAQSGQQWVSLKSLIRLAPYHKQEIFLAAEFLEEQEAQQIIPMNQIINYKEGYTYKGETADGVPSGEGQITYKNGDSYLGKFDKGRFQDGSGVFSSQTKSQEKLTHSGPFYRNEQNVLISHGDSVQIKYQDGKNRFRGSMRHGRYSSGQYWDYYQGDSHNIKVFFNGYWEDNGLHFQEGELEKFRPDTSLEYSFEGRFKNNRFYEGTLIKNDPPGQYRTYLYSEGKAQLQTP